MTGAAPRIGVVALELSHQAHPLPMVWGRRDEHERMPKKRTCFKNEHHSSTYRNGPLSCTGFGCHGLLMRLAMYMTSDSVLRIRQSNPTLTLKHGEIEAAK